MDGTGEPARQVDYDQLAPSYDQRYAASALTGVLAALQGLVEDVEASRILEVGCGTGRWLADLDPSRLHRCGLDSSSGMLKEARKRNDGLALVQGRAEETPFSNEGFDLVFCVNAIHHFDDARAFVREAHRLLEPGGALAVIGSDPHGRREKWYVYDFFEGTYDTDLRRFPSWDTLGGWMAASSFRQIAWQVAEQIVDHKIGRAVLEDPFLQKHACSQLALLTDEAYTAGIRRIEAALAGAGAAGETLTFPTDILLGMMVGKKGS